MKEDVRGTANYRGKYFDLKSFPLTKKSLFSFLSSLVQTQNFQFKPTICAKRQHFLLNLEIPWSLKLTREKKL